MKDKLTAFEQESNNRFELAANFINTVKQAEIIALQENPEQGRDFLKKIGSNFRLSGQKLFLDFKNPFKILVGAEPEQSEGEAIIAQNQNSENWRWERDSNPRNPCGLCSFQDCRFRPLSHPTKSMKFIFYFSERQVGAF